MEFEIRKGKPIIKEQIIALYTANKWSSAQKPDLLYNALINSDLLIHVYELETGNLIGLGNAISDGYLVVYYPHLLVHPDYHKMGVGYMIMKEFQKAYGEFHQQMITAENHAISFYEKCGFERAGATQSMWIYKGKDG